LPSFSAEPDETAAPQRTLMQPQLQASQNGREFSSDPARNMPRNPRNLN
jgi:hypothetical protein